MAETKGWKGDSGFAGFVARFFEKTSTAVQHSNHNLNTDETGRLVSREWNSAEGSLGRAQQGPQSMELMVSDATETLARGCPTCCQIGFLPSAFLGNSYPLLSLLPLPRDPIGKRTPSRLDRSIFSLLGSKETLLVARLCLLNRVQSPFISVHISRALIFERQPYPIKVS